jgi:hypothetical protein
MGIYTTLMGATMATKSWKRAYSIERCYVSCITDAGMEETYDDEEHQLLDHDDLRIAIKLIDSTKMVLDMQYARIVLKDNDLVIEHLVEDPEVAKLDA